MRPETQEYYLQDDLGSPIRLLSESGEVTESYGYDEFGRDLYGNQGEMQPFGYTGYQYDRVSGTYFAQAREYVPGVGRFVSKDGGKYFIAIKASSWNLYNYCACNPFHFIDPKGHENRNALIDTAGQYIAENDKYGMQLGMHWLYGNGKEINITPESAEMGWKLYMESNKILTGKVGDVVVPIGEALDNGEEIDIEITMSMVIENGEGAVGYYFLHGTDAVAGGFQIEGTVSKNSKGDTSYDLIYTWNDVMNPNFIYDSDIKKSNAAKSIPFANPTDYNFTLSWHDISVIKADSGWFNWNTGWLSGYKTNWVERLNKKGEDAFNWINIEEISLGALGWDEQLKQIYEQYSFCYDCEVD